MQMQEERERQNSHHHEAPSVTQMPFILGTSVKSTNNLYSRGQNQGGGWRWGREVSSAGVGWRDGEKRHTTVIE